MHPRMWKVGYTPIPRETDSYDVTNCRQEKTTTEHNPIRGLVMNTGVKCMSLYERENMCVSISRVKIK